MTRARFAAIALVAALTGVAFATDPAGAPRPNPHGAADGCGACHLPAEAGAATPGAALPVVATCRGCHPTADMHPVGMAPSATHVPADFPLEDGKVVCSTCHDEPAHGGAAADLPAPYHRGGPYPSARELCWSCHARAPFEKSDPHHPTTARDPGSPTCAACHTVAPTPGAPVDRARLRMAADETCTATCHTGVPHAGVREHQGKVVPEGLRAALPEAVALSPDGAIGCFTCHEVHDGASAGARDPGRLAERLRAHLPDGAPPEAGAHAPLLALPIADGALCRACHGDGP